MDYLSAIAPGGSSSPSSMLKGGGEAALFTVVCGAADPPFPPIL